MRLTSRITHHSFPTTPTRETLPFIMVYDQMVAQFGPTRAMVLSAVLRYARFSRGVCNASVRTIATRLHLNPSTVYYYIKEFTASGYLEDLTPGRRRMPHEYRDTGKAHRAVPLPAPEPEDFDDERDDDQGKGGDDDNVSQIQRLLHPADNHRAGAYRGKRLGRGNQDVAVGTMARTAFKDGRVATRNWGTAQRYRRVSRSRRAALLGGRGVAQRGESVPQGNTPVLQNNRRVAQDNRSVAYDNSTVAPFTQTVAYAVLNRIRINTDPPKERAEPARMTAERRAPELDVFRTAAGFLPGMQAFDEITNAIRKVGKRLGRAPTADDLKPYVSAWVVRGWRANNLAWLCEWATAGVIPAKGQDHAKHTSGRDQPQARTKPGPTAEQLAAYARFNAQLAARAAMPDVRG